MIGRLKGTVDAILEDCIILDVNGVGYRVFCTRLFLDKMALGQQEVFEIITHVREDRIHLYGFKDNLEKEWFNILLTVQGVGTRMALAILSCFSPMRLMETIHASDSKSMQKVSGVGAKLAERILRELQGIVAKQNITVTRDEGDGEFFGGEGVSASQSGIKLDAVSALINLGYDQKRAEQTVERMLQEQAPGVSLEDLIRLSLREMMS